MDLKLLSIEELKDKNFVVPSYQRGYRWNELQVQNLLEDIYEFAQSGRSADGEFYCLQPVVVAKENKNDKRHNSFFISH